MRSWRKMFDTGHRNEPPQKPVTLINPLRYFLVIANGVFLRDLPVGEVVKNFVTLALIAVGALSAAARLFRRRLE